MADDESLQDLVLSRLVELQRERGGRRLTLRQVAVRSFGRISEPVLRAVVAGHPAAVLSEREIRGLAVALDLPLPRVLLAATNG